MERGGWGGDGGGEGGGGGRGGTKKMKIEAETSHFAACHMLGKDDLNVQNQNSSNQCSYIFFYIPWKNLIFCQEVSAEIIRWLVLKTCLVNLL